MKKNLDGRVICRLTKAEEIKAKKIAAELELSISQFVRLCLATEMARRTMDPETMQVLAEHFREGVETWIRTKVDHEISVAKAKERRGRS